METAWMGLVAWCGLAPLGGGVGLSLFLMGAVGGVTHCAPMCGGFVLGQTADRMARLPVARLCEWRRVEAAALLPFHAGRVTAYAFLGAVAGQSGARLGAIPWLAGPLLLLGAFLLARQAAGHGWAPSGLYRWLSPLLPHGPPRAPSAFSAWRLGVCLGFLPCGLVYAALILAAAAADPWIGALGMAAFALGTVPALVLVGFAGHAAGARWRRQAGYVVPGIMAANAVLLTILAARSMGWI